MILKASPTESPLPTWDPPPPPTGQVQALDPLAAGDWDTTLSRLSEATVFHSRGWALTLATTYNHKPCYLGITEAGTLKALLPLMEVDSWLTGKKGVSLPFTDFCPPIGSEEDLRLLFRRAVEMGEKEGWKYLELRGVPPGLIEAGPSVSFLGHSLDLTQDEEHLFRHFEASVRRAIRKAESSGAKVTIGAQAEDIHTYYDLHCRTRQRHGLPPQPVRFFEKLHQHLLAAGQGFVATAHHQGNPIASAVFLHFGRNAIYKYGASDFRYQDIRGNNLVMWHGIQTCRRHGCHLLHFGRTSRHNEGLRRFKLGFGTQEQTVDYLRFDLRRHTTVAVQDHSQHRLNQLFRHLPRTPARWVGAALYPHAT